LTPAEARRAAIGQFGEQGGGHLNSTPSGGKVRREDCPQGHVHDRGGELRPGDVLPAERELATGFRSVGRSCERRWMLAVRGLVSVRQGKPTYLNDVSVEYP